VIAEIAQLALHKDNVSGTYAPAPKPQERRKFCRDRGIDFLLTGSLKELYGRWVLTYDIYRSVDDSVFYSDSLAFEPAELESMLPQIASTLYREFSGSPTGAIRITAKPDDSAIVVNDSMVGRGATPLLEGPPETVIRYHITMFPAYFPLTFITT